MSGIQFLASSKPFKMPDEIQEYIDWRIYELGMEFSVHETDDYWYQIVQPVLTMPYIYEVSGIGNYYFFVYLEKYMEIGDIIELYEIPIQDRHDFYIKRVLEHPEPITINVGGFTYQNQYGTFQFNHKNWLDELKHRTLLTERGITTIVNY
ncbi:hypothetical protein V7127_23185 [Bacillus sp. JJ1773]|uniref:hypothetical protein n=1 Tax=Bacillus sp. JJ1773 TaxID=3122965 RepID=UPI0030005659